MEVISNRDEMVFRQENNDKVFYSIGLSKKDKNGSYVNGYMSAQFKKDVSLNNQTKIRIKKAWVDFYIKDKKTIPYIFISEFDILDHQEQKKEENPFEEFGNSIKTESEFGEQLQIEDSELPF